MASKIVANTSPRRKKVAPPKVGDTLTVLVNVFSNSAVETWIPREGEVTEQITGGTRLLTCVVKEIKVAKVTLE